MVSRFRDVGRPADPDRHTFVMHLVPFLAADIIRILLWLITALLVWRYGHNKLVIFVCLLGAIANVFSAFVPFLGVRSPISALASVTRDMTTVSVCIAFICFYTDRFDRRSED